MMSLAATWCLRHSGVSMHFTPDLVGLREAGCTNTESLSLIRIQAPGHVPAILQFPEIAPPCGLFGYRFL